MGNCLGRCLAGKNGLRHSTDEREELVPEDEHADQNLIFRIMKFKRKKPSQFLDKFWEHQDQSYSRLNSTVPVESADIQLQCLDAQTLMVLSRGDPTSMPSFSKSSFQQEFGVASSSRASSSLDLEWEHEYSSHNNPSNNPKTQLSQSWLFLPADDRRECPDSDQASNSSMNNLANIRPMMIARQQQMTCDSSATIAENGSQCFMRQISKNSWSHISTPESLEWDIDEEQQERMVLEDDRLDHETLELLHEIELLKNKVLEETGDGLGFEVIFKPGES